MFVVTNLDTYEEYEYNSPTAHEAVVKAHSEHGQGEASLVYYKTLALWECGRFVAYEISNKIIF